MRQAQHRRPLAPRSGLPTGGFVRAFGGLLACGSLIACTLITSAQAQMVPRGAHILSQGPGAGITTARLPWPAQTSKPATAERSMATAGTGGGGGLALGRGTSDRPCGAAGL